MPKVTIHDGVETVTLSDYDALAARLAEAERLLRDEREFSLRDRAAWYDDVRAFLRATDSASYGITTATGPAGVELPPEFLAST